MMADVISVPTLMSLQATNRLQAALLAFRETQVAHAEAHGYEPGGAVIEVDGVGRPLRHGLIRALVLRGDLNYGYFGTDHFLFVGAVDDGEPDFRRPDIQLAGTVVEVPEALTMKAMAVERALAEATVACGQVALASSDTVIWEVLAPLEVRVSTQADVFGGRPFLWLSAPAGAAASTGMHFLFA